MIKIKWDISKKLTQFEKLLLYIDYHNNISDPVLIKIFEDFEREKIDCLII